MNSPNDMKDFKLDDHPKIKSGFTTPENYFDDFSKKIMLELPSREPKVISIFAKHRNWFTAAAAVLVLALMVPLYDNFSSADDSLDSASLENYITYQSDISQYDLVNLLDSKDIENIDQNIAVDDTSIEDVLSTTDNLENYITD